MSTIELIRKYAGKKSADEIAQMAGVSPGWARKAASMAGISLRLKNNSDEDESPRCALDQFLRRSA